MKNFTRSMGALVAFLFTATVAMAQTAPATYTTVGIIGSATTGTDAGWNQSIPMTLVTGAGSDGHHWTITLPLTLKPDGTGAVKFRANDAWAVNWGGSAEPYFPTNKGVQDGKDIPIPANGTYTATINDTDGSYEFTSAALATRSGSAVSLKLALAPNPARTSATIGYELTKGGLATVSLYNSLGQVVRQLPAVQQAAGRQSQSVQLGGIASGVYLVRVQSGDQSQAARLQVE